jgi:hypothetical protein
VINQYTVDLEDLQFATVICPKCKTEVTVDLAYDKNRAEPNQRNPVIPSKCPTCYVSFDSQIRMGLESIRDGYLRIIGQDDALVQFRVRENDDDEDKEIRA